MRPPTIVIIGAGSAVFGLRALAAILRSERLRGVDLRLVDVDEPALELMAAAAETMSRAWDSQARISATTERRVALPGADFVIVSVQVGPREEVWEKDWRIPLKHGIRQPYAENSGPGALAHTARNLPLIMAIARDMEELCPGAWYMNYVNPLIRLSTAIHRYSKLKVVGMCHQLLWGYAMATALLADRYGITLPAGLKIDTNHENRRFREPLMQAGLQYLDIKAAGINHFSWIYDIRDKATGEDLYPLLRERWLHQETMAGFEPLSREAFRIFGLMPTPSDSHLCEFLPWVHDPVKKPWERYGLEPQNWQGNHQRRADRRALARAVVEGDPAALERVRNERSEGIPEVVEGVHFNLNTFVQQLNLPNQGLIPNLPADAIVEVPGVTSGLGVRGLGVPALPEPIAELCRRELAYSSLVVDACYHGDRDLALQALLLDPMVNDIETARAILAEFLSEFAAYLPQFA
ncbi:MAG: alpha-glucosidase/alpha-galactosidase [Chloroflexi bacterium OHK40]